MSTEHYEPAPPPHPADPTPPRIADVVPAGASQSTTIEQTRAVAEVAAMVQVAHEYPRQRTKAITELRDLCGLYFVAERAFYEYKRAGNNITGPTIHLMVETANCWRNIAHGMSELARGADQSEYAAWAWDLERNVRLEQRWIVPHVRDTKAGQKPLTETRDVYEMGANLGSRRRREAIRRVLPGWFVDMAITLCQETLERGADSDKRAVPLDVRITDAVDKFDEIGVRLAQLEEKAGRPAGEWTARTLAGLHVTFVSIHRGELTVDEAFPAALVTGDEIRAQHAELAAGGQPPREDGDREPVPTPPAEYDADGNLLDPERPM